VAVLVTPLTENWESFYMFLMYTSMQILCSEVNTKAEK